MEIINLKIGQYKVLKDFNIDLSNTDGTTKKIIVLAGVNGSGKTSFLEYIMTKIKKFAFDKNGQINIITEFKTSHVDLPINRGIKIKESLLAGIKTIKIDESLHRNMEQYKNQNIYLDEKRSLVYTKANGDDQLLEIDKSDLFIEVFSKLHEKVIFIGTEQNELKDASGLIFSFVKKLIFERNLNPSDAYSEVQSIIDDLFEGFDLNIRFGGIDASWEEGRERFHVYFKNDLNNNIGLSSLSTGEKELMTKALYLNFLEPDDCIILIDEPERSLHPKWQQKIVDVYKSISKKYDTQIIIATHSPHIISSIDPEDLFIFDVGDDGRIRVSNMGLLQKNTMGVEPNRILNEIMGVYTLRHDEINKKIEKLLTLLSEDEFESDESKELISFIKEKLGEKDPFVIRLNHQLKIFKRKNNM